MSTNEMLDKSLEDSKPIKDVSKQSDEITIDEYRQLIHEYVAEYVAEEVKKRRI